MDMLMRYFEGVKKMKGARGDRQILPLQKLSLSFLNSKFILNILPYGTYSQSKY